MTLEQLETLLKALSAHGFTLPQIRTLLSLRSGNLNMTSIAKEMGVSTGCVTGSIDILEKKGLVERHYATDDRRQVLVQLTIVGRASLNRIESSLHSVN